jgi:uncharacterized protein
MKVLNIVAFVLLLIGGLNWGLVGFFNLDLVSIIFGTGSLLTRAIFGLVGLSALYKIFSCHCCHEHCRR